MHDHAQRDKPLTLVFIIYQILLQWKKKNYREPLSSSIPKKALALLKTIRVKKMYLYMLPVLSTKLKKTIRLSLNYNMDAKG